MYKMYNKLRNTVLSIKDVDVLVAVCQTIVVERCDKYECVRKEKEERKRSHNKNYAISVNIRL